MQQPPGGDAVRLRQQGIAIPSVQKGSCVVEAALGIAGFRIASHEIAQGEVGEAKRTVPAIEAIGTNTPISPSIAPADDNASSHECLASATMVAERIRRPTVSL